MSKDIDREPDFGARRIVTVDLRMDLPHPKAPALPVSYWALVQVGNREPINLTNSVELPEEGTDLAHENIRRALLLGITGDLGDWLEKEFAEIARA